MATIRRPRSFSDEFAVSRSVLKKLGVLNPILNVDTRLFIDPLLLESSVHPEISGGGRTRYKQFFADLAKLLGVSNAYGDIAWRNALRMIDFGEIRGTCLGYGANSIAGSAFGPALTEQVLKVAKDIVDLGVKDPDYFVLLALFEDGIGPDRISDMTTNIILPDLLAFNERILGALKIPTEQFVLKGKPAALVCNPLQKTRTPLILVPLDVLKPLPVAVDWEGVASAASHNEQLRNRVSSDVGAIWQAKTAKERAEIRARVMSSKAAAITMLDAIRAAETPAYDTDADPQGLLRWLDAARVAAELNPLTLATPKSFADVRKIVAVIVERFQLLVEKKGLAKELWHEGKARNEKSAQRLFFAIADTYCAANNLDVTPEADSGGGPVDFKFSAGYNERVLVEIKLSSNPKLVHGFTNQLEVYKDAEQTASATYLVIDVGGMGKKDEALVKLRNDRAGKGQPVSELVFVDGTVKPSASKR
jgi:hypothetical protein